LPPHALELLNAARSVMPRAYNLYSRFYVGAAVRTESDRIFTGTFMENASFGMTVCAEVSAVMNAINSGHPFVRSVAVVGGVSVDTVGRPVTPCGRCRQVIFEMAQLNGNDIDIYCADATLQNIFITTIEELLPMPFGPLDVGMAEDLAKYRKRLALAKDAPAMIKTTLPIQSSRM
jgi:cytidine deaminase